MRVVTSPASAYHVIGARRTPGSMRQRLASPRMSGRTPHGPIGRISRSMAVKRKTRSAAPRLPALLINVFIRMESEASHRVICGFQRPDGEFRAHDVESHRTRRPAQAALALNNSFREAGQHAI